MKLPALSQLAPGVQYQNERNGDRAGNGRYKVDTVIFMIKTKIPADGVKIESQQRDKHDEQYEVYLFHY